MWYQNIGTRFIHSVTKQASDRMTGGQTDGQNHDPQDRASIAASRGETVGPGTELRFVVRRTPDSQWRYQDLMIVTRCTVCVLCS